MVIIFCDANAAIGGFDPLDNVCGKFGIEKQDQPGIRLRQLLAMNNLCAPVTWSRQNIAGTWSHPKLRTLHQCDNIFMRHEQRHTAKRCWNSDMLTKSDHFSMRLQLDLKRMPKPKLTPRSKRIGLDFSHSFSPNVATTTCNTIKTKLGTDNSMTTLSNTISSLINSLPKKTRRTVIFLLLSN